MSVSRKDAGFHANELAALKTGGSIGGGPSIDEADRRPEAGDGVVDDRRRVMLIVSSLEHGGAERQVVHLANQLDPARFDLVICSLSEDVPLASKLVDRDARLHVVPKRWRFDVSTVRRVAEIMRRHRTQIVHSFLFDAGMVARLAARRVGRPIVIGSERNSDYRRSLLRTVCLKLTKGWHDAVISNSTAGKRHTVRTLGMDESCVHVVHNGVDTEEFQPTDRRAARRLIDLSDDDFVVGMVASFKPQKNHMMLLKVGRCIVDEMPNVQFVCIGDQLSTGDSGTLSMKPGSGMHGNTAEYRRGVAAAIEEYGLAGHIRLLGARTDVSLLYSACDLTVLTSRHEGTPNVVLESMACGVPVVVTDVSDNSSIVKHGSHGFVVPLDGVDEMAACVMELLNDPAKREAMGKAAREWVGRQFSMEALARKTVDVYEMLLQKNAGDKRRPALGCLSIPS